MRDKFRRGILLGFPLVWFFPVLAGARQLVIQDFQAQIVVRPDASIEVTEIIAARFTGQWHGIYRTIPVEYTDPQGFNYSLFLRTAGVTDDDGRPLKYESSRQGRYIKFKIFVPGAANAMRTIVLRYRVQNGLKFFADHDELYWNVTGNEWEVPIEKAGARIELPAGITGVRTLAFTGAYGSREQDAKITRQENSILVETRGPLGYREGLTAVVGWDKGFVHPPGPLARALLFLRSNWPFSLPIGVFFLMFWLWWTRGRDPRRLPVAVQYAPPGKLTPGEVGTLVDNEASLRDITATLVDLAVMGYLSIEQKEKGEILGLFHNQEYIFHLKRPSAEWSNAKPHEVELLNALFEGGARDSVQLSELQNRFYKHLPVIRDRIFDSLMSDGYYLHRPDKVRRAYLIAGVFIGFFMIWGAGFLSQALGIASLTSVLTGVFTGGLICGFGYFMPARTLTGARALEKILGFEDFLSHVEGDRLDRIVKTPELFEKFLPYAMALHVEKKWVQAFSSLAMQPPQWYQAPYGSGFHPYFLVNDLDLMTSRAGSVMASSPRSTGGSGFGGGGFSGGGFGGGGGGGF